MLRYFIINKPCNVLSQFTSVNGKQTLTDYFKVPQNVYSIGRLDYDSEGLLILTNDTQLNHRLLHPRHKHEREYWVQVEGAITSQSIDELQSGVIISIDGSPYQCSVLSASAFQDAPDVWDRVLPIRYRKNIPTSWIKVVLTEGKNRQVRKMTAKVGYPTLRLIRYRIQKLTLSNLKPGEMRELSKDEMYKLLF